MAKKLGVREICEVVLKAKTAQKIGKKIFYKNEPVMYFDTLKTSSLEGQATQVYAQGGRGNPRLIGWEGERTLTFTMEDALISAEGLSILSGAGLIDASTSKPIQQHIVETTEDVIVDEDGTMTIYLDNIPYLPLNKKDNFAYVMYEGLDGEMSEPMIPEHGSVTYLHKAVSEEDRDSLHELFTLYLDKYGITVNHKDTDGEDGTTGDEAEYAGKYKITVKTDNYNIPSQDSIIDYNSSYKDTAGNYELTEDVINDMYATESTSYYLAGTETTNGTAAKQLIDHVIVDYYTTRISGAKQIEITADKFAGNYYLEASTLFRDTDGLDLPAEFIIPNAKIQSNFTFTMANSGDPSTFTFTMDAFPDYTRFDRTHKVLCAIQVIETDSAAHLFRDRTDHNARDDRNFD